MANITQMDLINANIEYNAKKGTSNKDITRNILNEWRGSQPILDMQEAQNYYKVQNTKIEEKSRDYKDPETGKLIQNPNLSNVKNKTAQYRKSVNQKYNFSMAKPFVISCNDDKYKEKWEEFLTTTIRSTIQRTGKSAINQGICFVYPWINEKGILDLVELDPTTTYPAWKDVAHTELDFMVRDYIVKSYNDTMTSEDIHKVEFWDNKIVEKYIDYSLGEGNGDLVPDTNGEFELSEEEEERATIQQTHMKKNNGEGVSWDRVPFIWFKGCQDEMPLLNECKSDIDSYDSLKSKAIDSLLDDIDPTLVIEGISPEMGELINARKMIQNSRIVSLDPGGKAYNLKTETDITAIAKQLEIIKKDIQDNTSTVDLTTIQLGTNPSGQSMKAFYESLNIWCNGFENEFRIFMENLKYFFDKWLSWAGGFGTFEELQQKEISFTLDRDMMINETEIIQNISTLRDELSQETRDEMNPYVENHEKEQKRRDEDMKKEQENSELYQFDKTINETPEIDKNEENNSNEN